MAGDEPEAGPSPADPSDRARDGVEHLQAAARELIAAARVVLDVAEELLDDPAAVAGVGAALASVAGLARDAIAIRRPTVDPAASRGPGSDDGGVQRIPVR